MKIKNLDIVGFKSFFEKASINFPPGISAIVGPNGCGKSNVIDALRWVMGEQSVKQLRGKSMEDIIFSGANGKPPLNMAEVTITLANDNGHAPEEFKQFSEISVTRRLFRSGESIYMINRQLCRLKDIFNLFMGSGVGNRTFAIIQQGNIGAIIDAGPDERRLFIEEAAGVTRYKFRKNEALRKVNSTEHNLLRINDIISEVNRQMAGLSRQARKAERYSHLKKRFQQIDGHLLLYHFDYLNNQLSEKESFLRGLKDADINHVAQLRKIDAEVENIKLRRSKKNQVISSQKADKFETQRQIDRLEGERKHLQGERSRLSVEVSALCQTHNDLHGKTISIHSEVSVFENQNRQIQSDIDEVKQALDQERIVIADIQEELSIFNAQLEQQKKNLLQLVAEEARYKNIYQNASNNKANISRRLKRIGEETVTAEGNVSLIENKLTHAQEALNHIKANIANTEEGIDKIKSTLSICSAELGSRVKKTHEIDIERNKIRSHLSTLKKMASNYEWYRDGVKAIMSVTQRYHSNEQRMTEVPIISGIVGPLADVIEPMPGYEIAVEAVMGESLQYILVDDQRAGVSAVEFLMNSGEGRSGFFPVNVTKKMDDVPTIDNSTEQLLINYVKINPKYRNIAQTLLGNVVLVQTLDKGLELYNQNRSNRTIVTPEGHVVSQQGFIIGGSKDKISGILAKKAELREYEGSLAQLESALEESHSIQQSLESSVRELETDLQQAISIKNHSTEEALDIEKAIFRIGEELKTAQRQKEIIEIEKEQLLGEESDLDDELRKHNKSLDQISGGIKESQQHSSSITFQITQINEKLEVKNQKVVDAKLQLTAFNAKLETGLQSLNRLKEFQRDSQQRLEQLNNDITHKRKKHDEAEVRLKDIENGLQQLYKTHRDLEISLSTHEIEFNAIDTAIQESDRHVSFIQSERERTLEKIRMVELDFSEKRMQRESIISKIKERYHCSVNNLRSHLEQQEPIQMLPEEMENELERYRVEMNAIGDVNLGAIKEYGQLKERFDFLNQQRDDLVRAIEDLHTVIRKINRITQERFMTTLELVNEKLQEIFPKLFEGGSAQLQLSVQEKPLETGVEFLVHPPGKKLTRMSLLSGGEKALSAIAFIFAIFLIRPASFCLLDEIDAPLDEANIVRFNNLMQIIGEKSQIIMITHNKKSMEFADTLFGITMEQKGVSKIVSVNLLGKAA
jgi:chromosome segregation protein